MTIGRTNGLFVPNRPNLNSPVTFATPNTERSLEAALNAAFAEGSPAASTHPKETSLEAALEEALGIVSLTEDMIINPITDEMMDDVMPIVAAEVTKDMPADMVPSNSIHRGGISESAINQIRGRESSRSREMRVSALVPEFERSPSMISQGGLYAFEDELSLAAKGSISPLKVESQTRMPGLRDQKGNVVHTFSDLDMSIENYYDGIMGLKFRGARLGKAQFMASKFMGEIRVKPNTERLFLENGHANEPQTIPPMTWTNLNNGDILEITIRNKDGDRIITHQLTYFE